MAKLIVASLFKTLVVDEENNCINSWLGINICNGH